MNLKNIKDAESCEMDSLMDPKNRETIVAILELIRQEPRGLTVTDIALQMKLNRNTVRKYTLMLTAGGYIEERMCGHTKIFTISNCIPFTSVLDYAMEGIVIIDENNRISYFNNFITEGLHMTLKDLRALLIDKQILSAINETSFDGLTEKNINCDSLKIGAGFLKLRFVSANCFNGEKKTVIYISKKCSE